MGIREPKTTLPVRGNMTTSLVRATLMVLFAAFVPGLTIANTAIGSGANVGSGSLDHATAIGAGAIGTADNKYRSAALVLIKLPSVLLPVRRRLSRCASTGSVFWQAVPRSLIPFASTQAVTL